MRYISIIILSLLFFSNCQKIQDSDDGQLLEKSKTQLNVFARASENSLIEYPLYVFAFDSDGLLKASQKLLSEDDAINLELSKGEFRIVAISGLGEEYTMPDKPSLESIISIKDGCASSKPLMFGSGDIVMNNDKQNITIMMKYAVSSINIFLDNILYGAKNVYFMISSVYSSLSFNDKYSDIIKDVKIKCRPGADGKWIAGPFFFFPNNESKTIFSVIVENKEDSNTYSYTYNGKIEVGTPFIINGNYDNEINLGGEVVSGSWNDAVKIDFTFGESNDINGNEEGGEEETSEIPAMGILWNGTIVADVGETINNETELLLLSTKIWDCRIGDAQSNVDSYEVNGIAKWRIPTYLEATFLRKVYNDAKLYELNEILNNAGYYKIYGDEDIRYICYGKESGLASFRFSSNSNIVKATNPGKYYYLRAVKTYKYISQ